MYERGLNFLVPVVEENVSPVSHQVAVYSALSSSVCDSTSDV